MRTQNTRLSSDCPLTPDAAAPAIFASTLWALRIVSRRDVPAAPLEPATRFPTIANLFRSIHSLLAVVSSVLALTLHDQAAWRLGGILHTVIDAQLHDVGRATSAMFSQAGLGELSGAQTQLQTPGGTATVIRVPTIARPVCVRAVPYSRVYLPTNQAPSLSH